MSASLKNQQGFSLPEVMLAMVLMVMIVTGVIGFPANINEQSCQQKPVPTALAVWLAANATARDFATC
ncbi:prepilin peptidase-dependent protein C [Escherichia coli]|uniref:Prepilin peptidase-dependent protein C n=1 Tax=Escherichia coli TaxID=562 RepID=A0A376LA44_ECOLX|nr:prepilin peptidase-dependent protein C [Escherichia coli]